MAVLRSDESELGVLYATFEVAQAHIQKVHDKARQEANRGKR